MTIGRTVRALSRFEMRPGADHTLTPSVRQVQLVDPVVHGVRRVDPRVGGTAGHEEAAS